MLNSGNYGFLYSTMNSILIALPILTLLMFDLGLSLEFRDFLMVVKRPRAMFAGMLGQLILPLLTYVAVIRLRKN